ncbi:MAG: universal stress protein [Steroidobacteraceae bacterium]
MYQKILVAVDGSRPGRLALEEAIRLAREQGAKLRILHVVDEGLVVSPDVPSVNLSEVEPSLLADGKSLVEAAKSRAHAAGVETETVLLEEMGPRAGARIVEQARQWPADLIVCGTHGRRGIGRLLMGSNSEYVARHTPVPVLLLRAQD